MPAPEYVERDGNRANINQDRPYSLIIDHLVDFVVVSVNLSSLVYSAIFYKIYDLSERLHLNILWFTQEKTTENRNNGILCLSLRSKQSDLF